MNVLLLGYGKMGKAIEEVLMNRGHEVQYAVDKLKDLSIKKFLPDLVDVAIDFSAPQVAVENIEFCLNNGIPVLSGTTGWLESLEAIKIKTQELNGTFFYASNYSIGVNLFFKLNKDLAELLNNYDYVPGIKEIHHTQKLDAPSGTAITLAEDIIQKFSKLKRWVNHDQPEADSIEIKSLREDDVPGTHSIIYRGLNDKISISHQAFNRMGFATGAVDVAEWLIDKKGVLSMNEFLDG